MIVLNPLDLKYKYNTGAERIVLFLDVIFLTWYDPEIVNKILEIEESEDDSK